MPVVLNTEHKTQLDKNIRAMLQSGATETDVTAYASDFKNRYGEKKNQVGGVDTKSNGDGQESLKKSNEFPLTYKREKGQLMADIRTPEQKVKVSEGKPIAAGFTQVQSLKKDETFKVEITDKEAEDKAVDSFRNGEHSVEQNSQDPVGELASQINIKKYSYPDYKVARKKIEILNDNFFSTGEDAKKYLEQNQDKPETNVTKKLAEKRFGEYRQVEDALKGSNSLEEAAINYAANSGNQQVKFLLESAGTIGGVTDQSSAIPKAMKGELLLSFMMNKDLRQMAEKNPDLNRSLKEDMFNFPNHYPEYAEKLMAEAIAKRRDEKGENNSFANIVSKENTDKIVKELIEDGTLPGNYQFLYEKPGGIRSRLGTWRSIGRGIGNAIPGVNQLVNEAPIPTPGLLESFEQGFENTQVGIAKSIANLPSVAGLPTVTDIFQPEGQQVFNVLKKQSETPHFEPSGLSQKMTMHGGNLGAFVAGLAGGSAVLKGSNLIKNPTLANAAMMVLATHGDTDEKAKALFPRNDFKQHIYIASMDGLNAAMGRFLPGQQIPKLLSKGEGTVADILSKMVDGKISTSAAKNQIMEWFGSTAKSTLSGAEFMGAISAADDALTQTLEGKNLKLDQTLEAGWEGFKLGLIATPILGGFEASLKSNKGFRDQILDMAERSDYYKDMAEYEARKDPEFAKIKDDVIHNIDFVGEVYKEVQDLDMSTKDKQKYLLNSLAEKIKLNKAESATDPTIKKQYQEEAKDLNEVKAAALNGIPEEKVKLNQAIRDVKELYTEDFLSKGAKELLESKKTEQSEPAFDEGKVKSFLKFVAQQSNNITEDGKFNEGSDVRKSIKYPKQLIELANEMFPEYQKTAEEFDAAQEISSTPMQNQKGGTAETDVVPSTFEDAGKKSKETQDASHIGRWLLGNAQEGDVIKNGDGGYEITKVTTKKDGTKEVILTPFEVKEDGTKEYNHAGVKLISESSIKNASNVFENTYTNNNGERVTDQSTYETKQKPSPTNETKSTAETDVVPSTSVIMPGGIKQPETTTISPKENIPESKPKISVILPESKKEVETTEIGPPPTSEPPKSGGIFSERPATELSHRGLQDVANEFSLPDVKTRDKKTDVQLRQDARETVEKWAEKGEYAKNVERLVQKAEKDLISDEERIILEQHLANVSQEFRELSPSSPEFDAKLAEIKRLKDAGERVRSELGAALRIPTGGSRPKDIPDAMVEEMDVTQSDILTNKQKETVVREFKEEKSASEKWDAKKEKLTEERDNNVAQKEVDKVVKAKTKTPKNYAEKRQKLKEDLKAARAEHEKWMKDQGIQKSGFGSLTGKEAKIILEIAKEYIEEGAVKLADTVQKTLDDIKGIIPDITERDVRDVIAGKYSEQKTRSQLAIDLQDLRTEQNLLDKLAAMERGEEPKSERNKRKRNQQITDLENKIKTLKSFDSEKKRQALAELSAKIRENKKAEKEANKPTEEESKLASYKKKAQSQIEKIEQQIKEGDFAPPKKPEPIKMDAEAIRLKDRLIKIRNEKKLRQLKQFYENQSDYEKGVRLAIEIANIPRALMATLDFSALLRQAVIPTVARPRTSLRIDSSKKGWDKAQGSIPEMFRGANSQRYYDRWFDDLAESPRFEDMKESGLAITDSTDPNLRAREEAWMSGLADKIPVVGKTLIKGSERAYSMGLNKIRVDLYNRFADAMEQRGLTVENSPKQYKQMAAYINNATGRGDIGDFLNKSAPLLNALFFSPRLIASRVNMLTYLLQPRFYRTVPKEVRKAYLMDMAKFVGIGISVLSLAKLMGADVETDPRSSDFGKIKSGNTRWDIWGGFQQYARAITQIWTGERKSTNTGEIQTLDGKGAFGDDWTDVGLNLLRGKLAPVPSMIVDLSKKKNIVGEKIKLGQWTGEEYDPTNKGKQSIGLGEYLGQHFLPLNATGLVEALKERGMRAWFDVGVPSTFGIGVQTYSPRKPSAGGNKTKKTQHQKNRQNQTQR